MILGVGCHRNVEDCFGMSISIESSDSLLGTDFSLMNEPAHFNSVSLLFNCFIIILVHYSFLMHLLFNCFTFIHLMLKDFLS